MISYKYAKSNISNFENLNIVGILLGGSIPYKYQELNNVEEANDWDGVILVKKKIDIVNLVNLYRSELCDLLDIEYEEFPGMKVPSDEGKSTGAIYKNFDAIRFVGWTSNRVKKGAKILSVEYFNEILTKNHPSLLNLLSFKDVRYAEGRPNQYRISQAARLDYELLVIHDMDIYLTDPCPKHGGCSGVFGAAIDLFMTGISVYDDGSHTSERISEEIVFKFQRIHTASLTLEKLVNVFKNYPKFLPLFRRDFVARISNYFEKSKFKDIPSSPSRVDCSEDLNALQYCYWGVIPDVLLDGVDQIVQMKSSGPPKNVISDDLQLKKVNSQSGYCEGFYWKHTPLLADELAGAKLVSRYYRFTQKPEMVDVEKKIVFYPFFDGITLNAMRLEYTTEVLKNNGNLTPNTRDIELIILMVHLQLSEDFLCAYCASAAKSVANVEVESRSSVSNIHRIYQHYLVNDARLCEFYEDGIDVQGKTHLTIEKLKVLKLVVNGKVYGKLGDIICKAAELLDPLKMNNELIVCGKGDGHCGNVLVRKEKQTNSSYKYQNFDYEMAGYHSPILDLAKPFYFDVFYNILYADKFLKRNLVNVELITGDVLKIDLSTPKSSISKAIYGIYIRYVLLPFLKFIENSYDLKLPSDWCSTFGHALFCCALFTRKFSTRSDLFFANLAVGVMLTAIESISDLDRIVNDLL